MAAPSRGARATAAAAVAVAAVGLALAALTVAAAVALRDSPALSLAIQRGDGRGGCHWVAAGRCVEAVAGVALGAPSLVREPEYLADGAALAAWFRDQAALHRALARARAEDAPVEVVLRDARGGPGARQVARASVAPTGLAGAARRALGMGLTALSLVAIGAFVLVRRPREGAARTLFAFGVGLFLCLLPTTLNAVRGVTLAPWAARFFWQVNLVGAVATAVALLHLTASFPSPRFGRATRAASLYAPAALGAAALGCELAGAAFQATLAFLLVVAGLALALLVLAEWRPTGQVQALQARWMRWGMVAPLAVVAVTRLPLVLGSPPGADDPTDALIVLSFVAFPAGVGAAILRDRLFDIEVVVRRTILGAVVTAAVLFGYYVALALFAGGLAGAAPSSGSTVFLTAMTLAVLLLPGQARLEGVLDRVFARNRHGYRVRLGRVPGDLAAVRTSDAAARHVLDILTGPMEARHAVIALAPEVAPAASEGVSAWAWGDALPPPDAATWSALRALRGPKLSDARGESSEPAHAWMAQARLALVLPLQTSEDFIGVMACSAPGGSRALAADDIELLRAGAASLALALARARAYETVRRMNATLEELVERRTRELREAELQLFQREKMSSLGILAAGVAHELNSPLGVTLSTAEQLVAELAGAAPANERAVRLARLCRDASTRAAEIVQNLRDFSRPGQREPEWADLRENVRATLRVLGPVLRAHEVTAVLALGDVPRVLCHPALLNQVLANLVLNAVHAVPRGGTVTLTAAAPDGEHLRLVVEDTGPGVAPELRARIFEPFFTTRPQGQGTGLGLSLCFGIVRHHGGRIWEEGVAGRGARFVVELPIAGPPPR